MTTRAKSRLMIAGLLAGLLAGVDLAAQPAPQNDKPGSTRGHGVQPAVPVRSVLSTRTIAQSGDVTAVAGGEHTFEFIAAGYEGAARLVKDAPYSGEAVTEIVQTLGDGNRITRKNTAKLYRDSQGRTRREQTIGALGPWASAGEPAEMVFIYDPVASAFYVLNPRARTARKMVHADAQVNQDVEMTLKSEAAPTPGRGVRVRVKRSVRGDHGKEHDQGSDAEHNSESFVWVSGDKTASLDVRFNAATAVQDGRKLQVSTESLGTRIIEGVEAEGNRKTTTIPAGEIGNERPIEIVSDQWYSPDLQTLLESKRTDPRFGETHYRLTNVQRIEPLASLFEVPEDYKIVEGPAPMIRKMRRARPEGGAGSSSTLNQDPR